MVKKIILLPLVVLICFSLSAWDQNDPNPPYNYDIYNYYVERPWLLPPSEYKWYFESARKPPVYTTYNTYNYYNDRQPQDNPEVTPPVVVLPPNLRTPGRVALFGDPESASRYRFQDLDLSGAPPISGYQGLPWGTTISQFLSCFPDAQETADQEGTSPRVRSFAQHSADDGIYSRQFLFLDNQLYEVYVLYGYVDDSIATEMKALLARLYGPPGKTIGRTERFDNGRYAILDTYLGNDREMLIIFSISAVYDFNNNPRGKVMSCLFSNPQVRTQ